MDIAAHATGGINGIDILLWIGFLYLAPRLLTLRPRKRVPQRAPRRLRPAMAQEVTLKVA